jgi:FHA domain
MGALAVEVNDVGLVALRAGASHPLPESPGLVLLDGGKLHVGEVAAAQARLKPRLVHDSYWAHLDTEAAGRPFPDGISPADLAYAHLQALCAEAGTGITEAFLAVPGFWRTEALGLLLSVARAAGLPVVGLVDAAVAAAALGHSGETLLHVDLTRHRALVTAMSQGEDVVRTRVVPSEGRGWSAFEETWAAAVAGQFVRETRFDPLHGGASEQALYDALPGWLAELSLRPAFKAALRAGGLEHRVELTRASLVSAAAELYRGLVEPVSLLKVAGEPATVLLSHRAARLPGLADRLREIRGVTIVELHQAAAVRGALQHRERLRRTEEALPFVTRLPSGLTERERQAPPPPFSPLLSSSGARRPTHVLYDGVAHPIGGPGLSVGTAPPPGAPGLALPGETTGISRHHCTLRSGDGDALVLDHSSWGTFVNGERVAGRAVVHVGDRLRLGSPGLELVLIAVKE